MPSIRLTMLAIALISSMAEARAAEPAAPAEGATPRVGRYTMVPAEGGFVRLDTETGIVSHCRRDAAADAGWRCAVIPEAAPAEPARSDALDGRVDALEAEIAALNRRLDALAPPPVATGDADADRALMFSEEVMRRFFGLMREVRRGPQDDPDQSDPSRSDPSRSDPSRSDPGQDLVRP